MSDIQSGGISQISSKVRDDGIVEVTLPIVGAVVTTYRMIGNFGKGGENIRQVVTPCDSPSTVIISHGAIHGRNAFKSVKITGFNGGNDITLYHCLTQGIGGLPDGSYDHVSIPIPPECVRTSWYGNLTVTVVEKGTDGSTGKVIISGFCLYSKNIWGSTNYEAISTVIVERTDSVRIDWNATLQPLREQYDPTEYRILAYSGAVDPQTWKAMDRTKKDVTSEDTIKDITGDIERNFFGSNSPEESHTELDASVISGEYIISEDGSANVTSNETKIPTAIKEGDNCSYVLFHPYITLYLVKWSDQWYDHSSDVISSGDDESGVTVDNIDNPSINTNSSSGNTVTQTISGGSRIHKVTAHFGDYKTSYNIVYLSTEDYNKFVSQGGGIITNNFAHANDATLFIESITLSISGSTMTVIQPEKFDSTLRLQAGEYVFGYIINESGEVQPKFAGYVTSISRRLESGGQEIVYTCRDWKYYFSQLYTPVIYRKKDSLKNIVNEILIKAGITNFTNNLPDLTVTVEFQSQSITSVLDWACRLSGDYWYWIDCNGNLVIDKYKTTNHSFRVPSEGEEIGNNIVSNFSSVIDLSNSRSRVVVTGGSGSKIYERKVSSKYAPVQVFDSIQEAIDKGAQGEIGILREGSTTTKTKTYLEDDGKFSGGSFGKYYHEGDNYIWYKEGDKYYHVSYHWTLPKYDHYYLIRKKNVEFYSTLPSKNMAAWSDHYYCNFDGSTTWVNRGGISIQNNTVRGDSVVYAHRDHCLMEMYFAEKHLNEDLTVYIDTGNPGGTYIYKNPSFRYVKGLTTTINDIPIMKSIAALLAEYYKPIYGGTLTLVGLRTELNLGELITLTNTDLPSNESTNLKIFSIKYDLRNRTTVVNLSTQTNIDGTSIDLEVVRDNIDYYRRELSEINNYIIRTHVEY